ncbi:MAG: carbohydrate ABC transporter permease [Eubacteriales bacterium]|nr:carbohydrate ABC transporter permease [Eubacteriales bacterium]
MCKMGKQGERLVIFIRYFILLIFATLLLFPILFMAVNSFMSEEEVLTAYNNLGDTASEENAETNYIKVKLVPDKATLLQYYHALLRNPTFLVMFWNSVFLTVPIMLGQIFVAALGGYAFAKCRFPFIGQIFFLYIVVMLLPFQVTLVPNYIIMSKANLLGSNLSIVLPGIFSTFGVFLLRQFIAGIPNEYSESAKIDGAGHFKIFSKIIIPQCKGAIASLAILCFIDNWNMVEQPLIFLKDSFKYPMSIFLSQINSNDLGIAFACGILYMLPTVLLFLYGEDYLMQGIQLSGIK